VVERGPGAVLSPGDLVGVVAPGFAVRPRALDAGLHALSRLGMHVRLGPHVRSTHGYLAGTDDERAADLRDALLDDDVRAVWFARGGYGSARLLDRMPWRRLRRAPKPMLGYSDLTALFCAALRLPDQICMYGPVVTELGEAGTYHRRGLVRLLRGEDDVIRFARRQVLRSGRASGRLVGGNLAVLVHLLGTRYLPSLDGVVLALEEVGEEVYRIDRMLVHLRLAGALDRVAAVCLGAFDAPPRRRFPPDRTIDEVLRETFEPLGVPVVRDLPFGHVPGKRTLPLGGRAAIDTERRELRLSPRPAE